MEARTEGESKPVTSVERLSDREVEVRRTVRGPARLVYEAWTRPELFRRWWAPASLGLVILACELDVRVGGGYRLTFRHPADPAKELVFHGTYLEVVPGERLVWTNDEGGEGGAVTTVTFEERDGATRVVLRDRYPTEEAFEEGVGSTDGMGETFDQLEGLLAELAAA